MQIALKDLELGRRMNVINIRFFRDVTLCKLLEIYLCFKVSTASKMSVCIYQSRRSHIPTDLIFTDKCEISNLANTRHILEESALRCTSDLLIIGYGLILLTLPSVHTVALPVNYFVA